MAKNAGAELERLVEVMSRLRAEGGCPWDREQDLRSLRPYLLEESHEVLDEMDRVGYGGAWGGLCEELGDLLFQIVFHAQLASELREFEMADVIRAITDKIVSRHPHVWGDRQVSGAEQVLANWAELKAEEKKKKHGTEGSVLDGVPTAAPALMRAERLTEKASRIGFDWPDLKGVRAKLDEELAELDEAIQGGDRDELEHELGDVLFSLANLARFIHTPPEDALRQANRRFTSRFQHIERSLQQQQVAFGKASLEQMEALWQQAKAKEKKDLLSPRGLPRAPVVELRVVTALPAQTVRFWDAFAPLIGWRKLALTGPGAAYTDGALSLRLLPASERQGPAPLSLVLEAPSARAVHELATHLEALGIQAVRDAAGPQLSFQDPAGNQLTYTFPAAALSTHR